VLNGFSFALVCGILVGTYSSVFVASPIVLFWHGWADRRAEDSPVMATAPRPDAPRKNAAKAVR